MGDAEDAYCYFYRAQFAAVARTAYLIVHDRGIAEDVSQDAFAKLLRHWDKVSEYDVPEAWVRRVAIRRAVGWVRRERLRPFVERARPSPDTAQVADPDVTRAVAALPMQQRVVVVLFYYEDRSVAQIAEILGVGESAVKVRLHRARQTLAGMLREEVSSDAS